MDVTRKHLSLVCEVCGTTYTQQARVYKKARWKDRCTKHRGEFKPKGRRAKTETCVECGTGVYSGSTRCKPCQNVKQTKDKPKCVDCSTTIGITATRCRPCHNKNQDLGKSKERTKFQNSKAWKTAREECFARDNHTCQVCNTRGGTLECHHIKQWSTYPECRTDFDNLLTVCYDCHKYIHFGKHNRS